MPFDHRIDGRARQRADDDAHATRPGCRDCTPELFAFIVDFDNLHCDRLPAGAVGGKESLPHSIGSRRED